MRVLILLILIFNLLGLPSFADYPRRIVSGMPSITEMLFALGLQNQVIGVTSNCNYPPAAKSKEKIGGFFLNLEKVVSLAPDLVIMDADAQKRDIKKFEAYGLTVRTVNPHSVEEVKQTLRELGDLTGTREKAEEVVAGMEKKLDFVEYNIALAGPKDEFIEAKEETDGEEIVEIVEYHLLNIKQPQVLVVIGLSPMVVVGGETLIDDMLDHAGVQNIAYQAKAAYPQYSFENLLKEDPDYIIFPEGLIRREEIKRDNRWKSLAAVRRNKILFVNSDILSRPGPRVVEAIEKIADFVYQ